MHAGFFSSGKHASTLNDIFSSSISPFDICWVSFSKNNYFSTVDVEKLSILLNLSYNIGIVRLSFHVFKSTFEIKKWNTLCLWLMSQNNNNVFLAERSTIDAPNLEVLTTNQVKMLSS